MVGVKKQTGNLQDGCDSRCITGEEDIAAAFSNTKVQCLQSFLNERF